MHIIIILLVYGEVWKHLYAIVVEDFILDPLLRAGVVDPTAPDLKACGAAWQRVADLGKLPDDVRLVHTCVGGRECECVCEGVSVCVCVCV